MAKMLEARIEIGSRIRQLRRSRDLTIQELAELAGLSAGYLSEVERGQSALSGEKLRGIAHALGTSADYLLTGEDSSRSTGQEPLSVPPALDAVAKDLNLSYDTTARLLQGRQSLVARRTRSETQEWSKDEWIAFYNRIKSYLDTAGPPNHE